MKGLALVVLLVLSVCQLSVSKKRYDGHKVLRVDISNETDRIEFFQLTEKHLVDVWASNLVEGWAHVMLAPQQISLFENRFPSTVHIDCVQTLLDASEAEQANASLAFFDKYPTVEEVHEWLGEQIEAHSHIAKSVLIGRTSRGVPIQGIHMGDSTKPLIAIHCTIHAREWITTTTCCWIIDNLLNKDPEGAELLKNFQWIIIPILNVDGYAYTHSNDRLWRKNRETNAGSSCIGTDLNRNYGFHWAEGGSSNNPCSDIYHGRAAFSAPEINAERQFFNSYSNIRAFVDIHAYGGQFMSPYGYTTAILPPDYPEMDRTMKMVAAGIRTINGRTYAIGSSARVIYVAAGGSDDYFYGTRGVVNSFTTECYGSSFTPGVSSIPLVGSELWNGMKQLAAAIESGK